MSNESKMPDDLEIKQTPENVWQATSIILFAIAAALRRRELITASEIRRDCDGILQHLQAMIGDGGPGPGIYGTGDPELDHSTFATIQEMVEDFCKEQDAQEYRDRSTPGTSKRPVLTVVKKSDNGD